MKNSSTMQINLKTAVICAIFGTSALFLLLFSGKRQTRSKKVKQTSAIEEVHQLSSCLSQIIHEDFSVEYLQEIFIYIEEKRRENDMCRSVHETIVRVYTVSKDRGKLYIPESFKEKLMRWMDGDRTLVDNVQDQMVIYVHNKVLEQGTLYNPLRQKRPQPATSRADQDQIEKLVYESGKDCDFCSYEKNTAQDPFGHLQNSAAYSMANAFKLAAWNSMIAFRTHNPLTWSLQDMESVFSLAIQWFYKVHSTSPIHRYPMILWDMLPGAGASQVHPHIHVIATKDQYYGELDRWRQRSDWYSATYGSQYFVDLLQVSKALGLAVSKGNAHAVSSLTPQMDKEVMFLADELNTDLYQLIYHTIGVYRDHFQKFSFSFVLMLPPLGEKSDLPIVGRIAPRADLKSLKSDISSLHLFAAPEVSTDPFRLMEIIQEAVLQGTT